MEWITIVSLLVFGILLLVVEIVLVPGTTLVGLAGIILMAIGIWLGFRDMGLVYGYWMLGISVLLTAGAVYFGLKKQTWQRFTLTTVNKAKVNEDAVPELEIGEVGKTLSSLRPAGTVQIGDERIDVVTEGGFIPAGSEIVIIAAEGNRVVVRKK